MASEGWSAEQEVEGNSSNYVPRLINWNENQEVGNKNIQVLEKFVEKP